jgi:Protein of unknown function (DUF4230)
MFKRATRTIIAAIVLAVVAGIALQQLGLLPSLQTRTTAPVSMQISPVILEKVKNVNKQIFVEHYNAVDIDYSEAPQGWANALKNIGFEQRYVVLLRGNVPAGFDLTQMTERNIWVSPDGTRAQVTLPPPMIFEENVAIDFENTRIISEDDRCPDVFCTNDLSSYNDTILPEGRRRLIAAARENGILQQAADQGKRYYEQLFNQLGIGEVRVVVEGYDLP